MNRERAPFDMMANGERHTQQHPKFRSKLCRDFPFGRCRFGDDCSYLHVTPAYSPASQCPIYPSVSAVAQSIFQSYNPLCDPAMYSPSLPGPPRFIETRSEALKPRVSRTPEGQRRARPQKSHVEKWRLAIDVPKECNDTPPPAPPTTPTSATMSESSCRTTDHHSDSRWTENPIQAATERQVTPHSGRSSVVNVRRVQKMNQFFRTKPCKFFAEPTGCIKGDRCNFIHENPDSNRLPTGLAMSAEAMSESEAESAAGSSVRSELYTGTMASSDVRACTEMTQEEDKKNFYPVTWRVLGGGVTLGGRREVCQDFMAGQCAEGTDCKYAHPDTSEDESLYNYMEPSMFSPITPISPVSPVLVPYPLMYPFVSPFPTYPLPTLPSYPAVPSPLTTLPPPASKAIHRAKRSSTGLTVVTSLAPVIAAPSPYSPNRVVDGSTLLGRELPSGKHKDTLRVARAVVRPLSTPPTPVHGPDVGIAKLFAAEMP